MNCLVFHGFDYSAFVSTDSNLTRATLITGGVNFFSSPVLEEKKKEYLTESYLMRQAFSLSKSIASPTERREEAYFETVRSVLIKIERPGAISLKEINAQVNELLKQSVQSEGVINLFTDVDKEFNLFNSQVDLNDEFTFTGKTDEEASLVCPSARVPANTIMRDDGWRAMRIQGVLDFSLIGILSKIATVLAENKIGIFAVSTYNTDYILVHEDSFDSALDALKSAGYQIV